MTRLRRGPARSGTSELVRLAAEAMIHAWGAASPALVRHLASRPGVLDAIRSRLRLDSDDPSHLRLLAADVFQEIAAASGTLLKDGFREVLHPYPEVTVASRYLRGRTRVRQALPGAATSLIEILDEEEAHLEMETASWDLEALPISARAAALQSAVDACEGAHKTMVTLRDRCALREEYSEAHRLNAEARGIWALRDHVIQELLSAEETLSCAA